MSISERGYTRTLLVVLTLLCLSLLPPGAPLAALAPPVMHAATLAVTSPADSGAGSLRQAIIDAANGDTITFDLPANATITLASQIDFSTALTIDGAGAPGLTISGNNANRVFRIGAAVTLAHMTLANGLASGGADGGAVYVFNTSPLTLTNVVVRDSVAGDDGGGVYAAGPLTVNGGRFENNRTPAASGNNGGSVYAADTSSISGTQIISNTANFGGGVYVNNDATITSSNFLSNTATTGEGGGVYVKNDATISDSSFISNTAPQNGGGAYVDKDATISDSSFISNTAQMYGGGAYVFYKATITSTQFISNTAPNGGGGGLFSNTTAITGTQFTSNTTQTIGGGAFVYNNATITSSSFLSNTGSSGGGLFADSAAITSTRFLSNTAQRGGGAYTTGTVAITSTNFLSNTADVGGGAYVIGTAAITSSSFLSNTTSGDGGALYLAISTATIRASRLFNNMAAGHGGGIQLSESNLTLENSFLGGNTSQIGAADVNFDNDSQNDPSNLTAIHTTFAAATAGAGVAINAGGVAGDTAVLTNTLFADYGTALQAGPSAATITADGVLFSNVTTPTQTLTSTASITVTNAYTGTAAFVNAVVRNYHLTSASDAIDRGVASSVTTDIDGQTRPIGAAPDLGADEFSNTPPTAVDDSFTTPEDTPLTVPAPGVLGNDSDFDGDTLTAVLQTAPITGTLTLNADGAFTYTPPANFTGNVTWTYVANDGELDSQPATVTITVTPVNDPPTISAIANQTTAVDTSVGPLPFTVADADGDALTVTASSSNTALVLDASIVLGGSGANRTVTITPTAGQTGTATITLTVSDGNATASTTFTLTVTASGTLGGNVYLPLVQR